MKDEMKKIAILQSNYIPWKGYFDIINLVDEFVFYDEAQYTKRDWRNRNLIKTKAGLKWLTIPVRIKGKYKQKINETMVSDKDWAGKHWRTIYHSYSHAGCFEKYKERFEKAYEAVAGMDLLSEINLYFIKFIVEILGIKTKFRLSTQYNLTGNRSEKILSVCKQAGADTYITGPAAKSYIDTQLFKAEGISLIWMDYSGYPEYIQLYPPFRHKVSAIDLIFNAGESAKQLLKSFK